VSTTGQTLFLFLCLWIGANLLHAVWVHARRLLWERRTRRGADGLLPAAAAFSVGDGPVALLFVHGFADTPRIWARMADRLAASGTFRCRALRLPGSALPWSQAKHQSLALWRQAVDEEVDRLCNGSGSVWLVGHSLGGALAIDAALRRPDRVAGVAALAPLIGVSRKRSPLLPPAVWFRLASIALALSPTFESCFSADGVAVDDPTFTYSRDRFIPFCVYRGLFELVRANGDAAARLSRPLFVATADGDSVVDTPAALRWLDACPQPKRVRTLTGVGHVLPLETGWQTLADDLADFVRLQAR